MRVALLVIEVWLAVDVALVVLWLAMVARRDRARVKTMVRAAEEYANGSGERRLPHDSLLT